MCETDPDTIKAPCLVGSRDGMRPFYSSSSSACKKCFTLLQCKNRSKNQHFPKLVSFFLPQVLLLLPPRFRCLLPSANSYPISLSPSAGQINRAAGWDVKGGSRPSVSSLSPSPGRIGEMTGRGVGIKVLSGYRVYLALTINPLTERVHIKDWWWCCRIRLFTFFRV